jgi:DNA-binding transcriptional regulator YiaG
MNNLRQWRESKKLSRPVLARMLNKHLKRTEPYIGASHIQNWEQDSMAPADVAIAIDRISKGKVWWKRD